MAVYMVLSAETVWLKKADLKIENIFGASIPKNWKIEIAG